MSRCWIALNARDTSLLHEVCRSTFQRSILNWPSGENLRTKRRTQLIAGHIANRHIDRRQYRLSQQPEMMISSEGRSVSRI